MARIRTHPGEVLREEFMKPLGLSANAVALALRVPATRIGEILRDPREGGGKPRGDGRYRDPPRTVFRHDTGILAEFAIGL